MQHKVLSLKNSLYEHNIKSRWNALEGSKTALYRWRGFSSKLTSSLCKSMFHYNVSQREQLKKPNASLSHALTHYMNIQWSHWRTLNSQENTVVHETSFHPFLLNWKLYRQHEIIYIYFFFVLKSQWIGLIFSNAYDV